MLIGRLRQGVTMSTLRVHIKHTTKLPVIGQAERRISPKYRPAKRLPHHKLEVYRHKIICIGNVVLPSQLLLRKLMKP